MRSLSRWLVSVVCNTATDFASNRAIHDARRGCCIPAHTTACAYIHEARRSAVHRSSVTMELRRGTASGRVEHHDTSAHKSE
jgi:hypothetical protein